jgi:hypothetical protein
MRVIDFADMHESDRRMDTDRLMVEIQALEWVQGQISDLVNNNNERKEKRTVDIYIYI